ncbi:HAD-IA family hydrolase [Amycolatopsis echigonensis]|uniref:HAD-IA family hydrolase n=1 Tax=Amycolatopsis echigonensis TaxID=2576905 RepID=A0A8E1T3Z4_9PSEU|nr:HAD-IA family hydrolase [Amycolatopsis echigonensis]MBB2497669.1 HAD-IA family hydrolase [Amycolatopsis echigonensis]
MALTLAGDYEPFPKVAAAALRTLTRGAVSKDAVEHVLAGFAELPAHPDVEPALRLLAEHDVRVACLSNGAARNTQDFLQRTGLTTYVEQILSVADVRSWKPPAQVYHYALQKTGCEPEQAALVAVHAFDCHGARRAGLTTGWASRHEGQYAGIFAPADVVGSDLAEVAQRLMALPAGA